jgi:hypothetical protein
VKRTMFMILAAISLAACGGAPEGQPAADAANPEVAAAGGMSVATAKPAAAKPKAVEYREVTLPAGTSLALDLKSSVASDTSRIEDPVSAALRTPVVIDGAEILPAGTALGGHVTNADDSSRVKGRAKIAFRFTTLEYDGTKYDVGTATIARQAEATKGEDATKIGIGAGAGAALGAILGGGDGAAKGAAIGGAAGTGAVLATKGKEIRLGPGANVTTTLTEPLTVRVRVRG